MSGEQAADAETVVVAGGHAGLATGYLVRHGQQFVILDAGERAGRLPH